MQLNSYAVGHEAQTDKASVGEEEVISPHIALARFMEGSFITGGWGCLSLIHLALDIDLITGLAHCTDSSVDFLRGFGDGLLEIPSCDPSACFCTAPYS